jgi:hypothetical protein
VPTLGSILNNALYVSILVILISSLVGFFVKARARDRCLRDFDRFDATVETTDGQIVWGLFRVYSSGLELLYRAEHQDEQGHVENSTILYAPELGNLQAVYRFHHDQLPEARRRRKRDIERTYQPTLFRRAGRGLRNTYNAFRDAIVQTLNAILAYRATQAPQEVIWSRSKDLTASGSQLLSTAVGNAYEPILERYIGQYVVLEMQRGDALEEEYGILKEYSAQYIELLNARLEVPLDVYIKDHVFPGGPPVKTDQLVSTIRVTNGLQHTILIDAIRHGDQSRPVHVPVDGGQTAEIALQEDEMGGPVQVDVNVRCLADLIVPRTLAVVRHAGKREKLSLDTLLGLDELHRWPWVRRLIQSGQLRSVGDHREKTGA